MSDDEVQVPETSSPSGNKVMSSSPLKPTETESNSSTASMLRDKFTFKPEVKVQTPFAKDQAPANSAKTLNEINLAILSKEFSDFSPTLVQAVFKSNSFNIDLARERLTRIRNQRTNWSWSSKGKTNLKPRSRSPVSASSASPSSASTSRLESINGNDSSSKIVLDKQRTSIFDRYSSVMNKSRNRTSTNDITIDQESLSRLGLVPSNHSSKKRRLVRGDMYSTDRKKLTHLESAKENLLKMKKQADALMDADATEDEMSADDDMSGGEYEERTPEIDINDQILHFINTAEATDLSDLADTTIEKAKLIMQKRPFANLQTFAASEFITEAEQRIIDAKSKKRTQKSSHKKESERLLEKISQSIRGYNAIDSLIKKCSTYGDLLATQIKKWGVDLDRVASSGELDFMDVNSEDNDAVVEEFDDEEVSATPTPVPENIGKNTTDSKSGDEDDSDFRDEDDMEDEEFEESEVDDEYGADNRSKTAKAVGRKGHSHKKQVKYFKGKPKLLLQDVALKDYQQTGINWLNLLYHNQMSCILADDMGLGKTCQVISFLAYLKQINEPGPHLVVVPSSTLENWLREFQKFCPAIKVEPYYGSQQERAELRDILERNAGQYDVVVTTYNLAAGNKYDVSFLRNRSFNVVVYDEGHMLKNSLSERFLKLMRIQGNFRLLLTGTPLQNNLKELMSLLEFIMPSLFEAKKEYLAAIFKQRARTTDDNKGYNPLLAQEAINRAKTMMKPFILRRRKDQVLKHLPTKHRKIEYCEMNSTQKEIYDKEIQLVMEHKRLIREGVNKDANSKKDGKVSALHSKNLIMSLRKASLHPLLFRHIYSDKLIAKMSDAILDEPEYSENGNKQYIMEDMSYMSDFELHQLCCKFPSTLSKYQLKDSEWMNSGKVTKLAEVLKEIIVERKEKVLVFSLFTQVLDILEKVLSTLKYKFLRLDGSTQVNDRQALIDKFYEDESIPVFILSTKAGGFGINLVAANNVIIFDQSFNPHDDRQAADRAHRVGQTKEVTITTLITKNSIEEKIYQLAKNKLDLDLHVSEDDNKSQDALESKVSDILEDIIYNEKVKEEEKKPLVT